MAGGSDKAHSIERGAPDEPVLLVGAVRRERIQFHEVTHVTDPAGGNTTFTYDKNGNLLTLTDALNHTTTYSYDNMDRVATRTDPLLRGESYGYDLAGNLVSHTDRKGQGRTTATTRWGGRRRSRLGCRARRRRVRSATPTMPVTA